MAPISPAPHRRCSGASAHPAHQALQKLLERIAQRIAHSLERKGLLVRDSDHSLLTLEDADSGPMDDLLAHSITYRVAMGPRAGQKVLTLQTLPASPPSEQNNALAQACGFSLHAGIATEANARSNARGCWGIRRHGRLFRGSWQISDADLGRNLVTHDETDRYVFKVPSLRNVVRTAPYSRRHGGDARRRTSHAHHSA